MKMAARRSSGRETRRSPATGAEVQVPTNVMVVWPAPPELAAPMAEICFASPLSALVLATR